MNSEHSQHLTLPRVLEVLGLDLELELEQSVLDAKCTHSHRCTGSSKDNSLRYVLVDRSDSTLGNPSMELMAVVVEDLTKALESMDPKNSKGLTAMEVVDPVDRIPCLCLCLDPCLCPCS